MARSYRNSLIRIKANVYITSSHRTSLVRQRGRRSIVLEHSMFSMMYAMWNNLIGRKYYNGYITELNKVKQRELIPKVEVDNFNSLLIK